MTVSPTAISTSWQVLAPGSRFDPASGHDQPAEPLLQPELHHPSLDLLGSPGLVLSLIVTHVGLFFAEDV